MRPAFPAKLVLAWMLVSMPAGAQDLRQVDLYRVDLSPVLKAHGGGKVLGLALVEEEDAAAWAPKTSTQTFDLAKVFPRRLEQAGSLREPLAGGLKIAYDSRAAAPLTAALCADGPEKPCEPLILTPPEIGTDVEGAAKKPSIAVYRLPSTGGNWGIEVRGSPCRGGGRCQVYLPSWQLNRGIFTDDSALDLFPRYAAVVELHRGYSIIDAALGKEWLFIPRDAGLAAALGGLKGARAGGPGIVTLRFEHATLVLDLPRDRAFLVDAAGVRQGQAIFGRFTLEAFDRAVRRAEEATKVSRLVAVNRSAIVWAGGYAAWEPAAADPLGAFNEFPGISVFAASESRDGRLFAAGVHDGRLAVYAYDKSDPAGGLFKVKREFGEVGGRYATRFRLVEDRLYFMGKSGLRLLELKQPEGSTTSLELAPQDIFLQAEGEALVVTREPGAPPGTGCTLVHYAVHPQFAVSFSPSGLRLDCGTQLAFSFGATKSLVGSLKGLQLFVGAVSH